MMREYVEVKQIDPDELRLKKNVLLAYTDLTAAGSRALLGIDMRMEYYEMDVAELANHKPACVRDGDLTPTQQQFQPLQVLNCKYEQYSVVVVNTVVGGKDAHYVANRILDLCTQSGVETLTIFTVLKLETDKPRPMYENCFYTQPVTSLPPVGDETRMSDALLSTLLQMITVERLPTRVYTIPGHRGALGKAGTADSSKQHISSFQDLISEQTRLKFDRELSYELVYKGKNTDDLDMASMIYM